MANYITEDGYYKLLDEIAHLESHERSAISKQIAEARDKGDLSENAEYDAAKEAQSILESKIAKLKSLLATARIIDKKHIQTNSVQILNKITLRNTKDSQTVIYTLVPESEAKLKEGKISINSPIGKGLIGKKVGEIVEIQIPLGKILFEILDISI